MKSEIPVKGLKTGSLLLGWANEIPSFKILNGH
jgi:hypothetical protein